MIAITGASDGLGKALAGLFATQGKRVIGLSRRPCAVGIEHIKTDMSSEQSIAKAAAEICNDPEPLEALINCAGVLSIETVGSLTASEIDKVLNVNVRGTMLLTSALMEKIKKDGADIVNVASTIGRKGYVGYATYGVSKWALRGFSANLQVELKDYPSRVISFCPGGFKTAIFEKATGVDDSNSREGWMSAQDVAVCLKQLLELPKTMEVSDIVINRK